MQLHCLSLTDQVWWWLYHVRPNDLFCTRFLFTLCMLLTIFRMIIRSCCSIQALVYVFIFTKAVATSLNHAVMIYSSTSIDEDVSTKLALWRFLNCLLVRPVCYQRVKANKLAYLWASLSLFRLLWVLRAACTFHGVFWVASASWGILSWGVVPIVGSVFYVFIVYICRSFSDNWALLIYSRWHLRCLIFNR